MRKSKKVIVCLFKCDKGKKVEYVEVLVHPEVTCDPDEACQLSQQKVDQWDEWNYWTYVKQYERIIYED